MEIFKKNNELAYRSYKGKETLLKEMDKNHLVNAYKQADRSTMIGSDNTAKILLEEINKRGLSLEN